MKRFLKLFIPLLFICVFIYLGCQIFSQIKHKKDIVENIKTIPKFKYINSKGGFFVNESLRKNTPTIFIYFNSECEFCIEEAKMIKKNIDKLEKIQLVFISFEKTELIKVFSKEYQLNNFDNVYFLSDERASFSTTFDVKSLPCLVLYDEKQQLIEKIKGQVKVETILKKLNHRIIK